MKNLIVKGALYFDGDLILKPHFTGSFFCVDCTEYKTKEQIKEEYSKEDAKSFTSEPPVTHKGVEYFKCEYSPYNVSDEWELLSDLSSLEFTEEETEF